MCVGWWSNRCRCGFYSVKVPWSAQWLRKENAGVWCNVRGTHTHLSSDYNAIVYFVCELWLFLGDGTVFISALLSLQMLHLPVKILLLQSQKVSICRLYEYIYLPRWQKHNRKQKHKHTLCLLYIWPDPQAETIGQKFWVLVGPCIFSPWICRLTWSKFSCCFLSRSIQFWHNLSTVMTWVMSVLRRWINAADVVDLQELQLKHQALEAFHETVEVFDDQLRLHDRFKKKAAPQDLPKYA